MSSQMSKQIALRIGKNIAAVRKSTGRTQAELAEKIGIDTVSLSRIERGVVTPGVPTLDNIANELHVPLSRLFEGASAKSATLADTIISQLEPLNESDRLFLLSQLQAWVQKLKEIPRKKQ
jgi:transcriptional regulator with XRE-family HTH domain